MPVTTDSPRGELLGLTYSSRDKLAAWARTERAVVEGLAPGRASGSEPTRPGASCRLGQVAVESRGAPGLGGLAPGRPAGSEPYSSRDKLAACGRSWWSPGGAWSGRTRAGATCGL
jgi:hypothetical protein